MSILGLFLITVAKILKLILDIYTFLILGAVLISWFRPDPSNPIVHFINQVTEPIFQFIRKRLPASWLGTGIDFTPLIIFIALVFLDTFVVGVLMDIGTNLRVNAIVNSSVDTLPQI
jgi:YggT family protein